MKCSLENAVLCCISSWFSLFEKFSFGFPEYKGLINVINGFFSDLIKLLETEGPWVRASPASLRCGP